MAFVLNFLPTVGSLQVWFASAYGHNSIGYIGYGGFFNICFVFGTNAFWKYFEPIFMGKGVALNTIVVILGLVLWGYLWGFYGMLLSVPLMVTVKVILSNVEGAGFLVRLLGTEKAKRE
ncbi:MAG: AI-2E family transporter [Bacteroidetes bacterium]|nr:AI-2E family transporter [Bacteroidota bacterium]